jgi:hypothetical protein
VTASAEVKTIAITETTCKVVRKEAYNCCEEEVASCNTSLDLRLRELDIQDGNADERDPECLDGRGPHHRRAGADRAVIGSCSPAEKRDRNCATQQPLDPVHGILTFHCRPRCSPGSWRKARGGRLQEPRALQPRRSCAQRWRSSFATVPGTPFAKTPSHTFVKPPGGCLRREGFSSP